MIDVQKDSSQCPVHSTVCVPLKDRLELLTLCRQHDAPQESVTKCWLGWSPAFCISNKLSVGVHASGRSCALTQTKKQNCPGTNVQSHQGQVVRV